MLQRMQIDFVIRIKQVFEDEEGRMVLIMENCDQVDLTHFIAIHMGNSIQESVICRFLTQMLYVMIHMQNNSFLHRAIIPDNILITTKA